MFLRLDKKTRGAALRKCPLGVFHFNSSPVSLFLDRTSTARPCCCWLCPPCRSAWSWSSVLPSNSVTRSSASRLPFIDSMPTDLRAAPVQRKQIVVVVQDLDVGCGASWWGKKGFFVDYQFARKVFIFFCFWGNFLGCCSRSRHKNVDSGRTNHIGVDPCVLLICEEDIPRGRGLVSEDIFCLFFRFSLSFYLW